MMNRGMGQKGDATHRDVTKGEGGSESLAGPPLSSVSVAIETESHHSVCIKALMLLGQPTLKRYNVFLLSRHFFVINLTSKLSEISKKINILLKSPYLRCNALFLKKEDLFFLLEKDDMLRIFLKERMKNSLSTE